jgi:hypothetical protein
MRETPLRGGLVRSRSRVLGACVVAFAGIWLGSIPTAFAAGGACPNARFRSGASEHLPDCRAYEQVSPVEKGGLDAVALQPLRPAQSSPCEDGETCTIAYMNVGAAFAGAPGNEFPNAYLAARTVEGWQTTPMTPPTPQAPANSLAKITYAFSGDLSQTVLRVPLQQLTEGAPTGVYNLYVRQMDGSYSLVTANAPSEQPQAGCGNCFEKQDVPAFAGASSAFSHVIFEANDRLLPEAPGGGVENLYETVAGHVSLVGVLPDGTAPARGSTAGGGINAVNGSTRELEHAISADGSRVLFQAAADNGGPEPQQAGDIELFDHIDGASTIEISAPVPGAQPSSCETEERICDPQPAKFWAASENGSIVYFTSKAALTKYSRTGPELGENPGNDLYRFNVDTRTLTDLTVDPHEEDADGAGVLGVVGAATDGSYVYFVATGRLASGNERGVEPTSGLPNLYVWHETAEGAKRLQFIATLQAPSEVEEEHIEELVVGQQFPYNSDVADWTNRPTESQAYVTPDGKHLAFMSVNPLTGYENKDRLTGEADHEVFEYSAEAGQLVCASCDPSDAPPRGSAFLGAKLDERLSTPFHQPRSLSDDGSRLFFSSPDPLVPGLAGGSAKVFEYEGGAVQLISGMQADGEDVFLDASASGNDVFLATTEQLAPTDVDELADVYDARVDGGLPTPIAPTPCQGSACEGLPDPPPLFSAPISSSFVGPGNPTTTPGARLTRKQLLFRAIEHCRHLQSKERRAACIAAAQRRYGQTHKRARRRAVAKRQRSGE